MKSLIYIKNPRTGGTSLLKTLEQFKINEIHLIKSCSRVYDFKEKYLDFWNNSIKFVVVRNPYTKVLSGYNHHKACKGLSLHEVFEKYPMPKDFWTVEKLKQTKPKSEWDKYFAYEHVCLPQTDFLFDSKGNPMFDKLIRFENLNKEMENFLSEHEIKIPIDLPRFNRSMKKKESLTESEKDLVRTHFKNDFENFGYEF